jgi:hypothetical protein
MKSLVPVLTLAAVAGSVVAQGQNDVARNNDPWLVISAAAHPTTTRPYNYPPVSPAQFAYNTATPGTPTGQTVPAGTHTVRWIPSMTNLRREARDVTGFYVGLRPSAASATFPLTGYTPEYKIHTPAQLAPGATWASGAQYSANFTAPALVTLPQATYTFAAFGNYLVSSTLTAPVTVNQEEIVISFKWQGGENDEVAGTQSFFGGYADGIHTPMTVQFASPTNVLTPATDNFTVTWGSYFEDSASISAKSDWGYRRTAALLPSVSGYSVGTAQSDAATTAGQLGWDVFAGAANSGNFAIALFNTGAVFPASFPLFGQIIEMNLADPSLTLLVNAGYNITLPANGEGAGPFLPIPVLGSSAIGFAIGAEFLILRSDLSGFSDSTQSAWTQITR